MKFKELFGSFTDHRVENRSTRMRHGSTGRVESEKWRIHKREPVADGVQTVGDALQKHPSARFPRIQLINASDESANPKPVADGLKAVGDGLSNSETRFFVDLRVKLESYWLVGIDLRGLHSKLSFELDLGAIITYHFISILATFISTIRIKNQSIYPNPSSSYHQSSIIPPSSFSKPSSFLHPSRFEMTSSAFQTSGDQASSTMSG
ncbi:hypothetical protein Hdeb2414_s0027g00697121 [Helianthus debilis subsp. tardiflorus]